MAQYRSFITNMGVSLLTELLATGKKLVLTRAAAGDGRSSIAPEERTALAAELPISAMLSEWKESGEENGISIPVQLSNAGLTNAVYIREVGIFALRGDTEILFAYSRLEGEDSDNYLAPPMEADAADTIHIHEIGLVLENMEREQVTVEVSAGSYVSYSQLIHLAAAKEHRHTAAEIDESTGENTEIVQRRQDYEIAALKEALDTGFTGISFTHTFRESEMTSWHGGAFGAPPEGIYDAKNIRMYV